MKTIIRRVIVFSLGVLVSLIVFGLPQLSVSNVDVQVKRHDVKMVFPGADKAMKPKMVAKTVEEKQREKSVQVEPKTSERVGTSQSEQTKLKYSEEYIEGESVESLMARLSAEYPASDDDTAGGPPLDTSLKRTIVMTAECKPFLNWQMIVAVESLKAMNEKTDVKFNIVRLVSCALSDRAQLFDEKMRRISHFHLTPNFSGDGDIKLGTVNKPAALWYWMSRGSGKDLPADHEIIVTDSDFMFFNEIPYPLSEPGKPAAAHFELPRVWWKAKSIRRYCEGKCGKWDDEAWQAENSMGPPYVMRKSDADKLLSLWFKFTWAMKMDVTSTEFPDPQAKQPAGWYMDMFAYHLAVEVSELHHRVVWGWFLVTEHEIWGKLADMGQTEKDVWCIHYPAIYNTAEYFPKENASMYFWKHKYHDPTFYSCDADASSKYIWRGPEGNPGAHFLPPAGVLLEDAPGPIIYEGGSMEARRSRIVYLLWRIYRTVNDALHRWRAEVC